MSGIVLAVHWLVVAVGEHGNASFRLARIQARLLYGRLAMWWTSVTLVIGLQESARTLASVRAAASLFLFDSDQVMCVMVLGVIITVPSNL